MFIKGGERKETYVRGRKEGGYVEGGKEGQLYGRRKRR